MSDRYRVEFERVENDLVINLDAVSLNPTALEPPGPRNNGQVVSKEGAEQIVGTLLRDSLVQAIREAGFGPPPVDPIESVEEELERIGKSAIGSVEEELQLLRRKAQ